MSEPAELTPEQQAAVEQYQQCVVRLHRLSQQWRQERFRQAIRRARAEAARKQREAEAAASAAELARLKAERDAYYSERAREIQNERCRRAVLQEHHPADEGRRLVLEELDRKFAAAEAAEAPTVAYVPDPEWHERMAARSAQARAEQEAWRQRMDEREAEWTAWEAAHPMPARPRR